MNRVSQLPLPGPALYFRGVPYRSSKQYWADTPRSSTPEETLERIRPYFRAAGLTRIGNITGLDTLGIPVTIALRPNSQSIATSSGKGLTLVAAEVSAAMEALELYCGEVVDLPEIRGSYEQVSKRYQVPDLNRLALQVHALFSVARPERWVLGWDLVRQEEVAVPLWLVTTNFARAYADRREFLPFSMSSNGLASGNSFLEAVASALFELVERDSVTCHELARKQRGYCSPRVDPKTIAYPKVQCLLEKFERSQVVPVIYDCTGDTEIPVYKVALYNRHQRNTGVYSGYGAHLDPEVAMLRALTEAAQSRAIVISGARDDFFPHAYTTMQALDTRENIREYEEELNVDAGGRPSMATATFEGDLHYTIAQLKRVGLDRVIVVDISRPEFEFSVVRAIVPGLEGYLQHPYQPGQRALEFMSAKQLSTRPLNRGEVMHPPAGGAF